MFAKLKQKTIEEKLQPQSDGKKPSPGSEHKVRRKIGLV